MENDHKEDSEVSLVKNPRMLDDNSSINITDVSFQIL